MRVSKNISRGDRITSLDMLVTLAKEKKAVVVIYGSHFLKVQPAAFIINWPIPVIQNRQIFFAINHNKPQ
jgi:hypothetical protein